MEEWAADIDSQMNIIVSDLCRQFILSKQVMERNNGSEGLSHILSCQTLAR